MVSYTLRQQPAENVMVPQASAIEVIQPNNLDPIGAQKNHNLRFAQVSNNNVYQNDRTDLNIDEVILVKDDGVVPGVDGYVPKNNPRRRPRMRGSKSIPQNIQGLGNIPEGLKVRSFTEVDTGLNARRGTNVRLQNST